MALDAYVLEDGSGYYLLEDGSSKLLMDGPEFALAPSTNIASGGEASTQQLTTGSGTFTTGRMWDDENGTDTIDIGSGGYTEIEWCIVAQAGYAEPGVTYEFRVVADGVALATYTATPAWTISSGTAALSASGTGTASFTSAATAASDLSSTGLGTAAMVGASLAGAPLTASGTSTVSFSSTSEFAFNPVTMSRRYGRRKARKGFDFSSSQSRTRDVVVFISSSASAVLSASGTSTVSWVGASSGGTGPGVEIISRRYGRRKTKLKELAFLHTPKRVIEKDAVLYVPEKLPPYLLSRRQWRAKKWVDSSRFLFPRRKKRADPYYTRFASSGAAFSLTGTGVASFVGASTAAGTWSASGTGTMSAASSVVAAAVWTASGGGVATFASMDSLPEPLIGLFGRRRMVKQ